MQLTLEQTDEFESRARAGEKPRMKWVVEKPPARHTYECKRLEDVPVISIMKHQDHYGWWGVMTGPGTYFMRDVAAQLASEYVLQETSKPLHAEAYQGVERLRELWGSFHKHLSALSAYVTLLSPNAKVRIRGMIAEAEKDLHSTTQAPNHVTR